MSTNTPKNEKKNFFCNLISILSTRGNKSQVVKKDCTGSAGKDYEYVNTFYNINKCNILG